MKKCSRCELDICLKSHYGRSIRYPNMSKKEILFVTGNTKKLNEVQRILGDSVLLKSVKTDLPELQGDVETIAIAKSRHAYETLKQPCIVDDTSLELHSWNRMPGPFIKFFIDGCGSKVIPRMLKDFPDKSATARCIFGYMDETLSDPILLVGDVQGEIVENRGQNAFGWDDIFEVTLESGEKQTYAEMSSEVKNRISHRYLACQKLKEYLGIE